VGLQFHDVEFRIYWATPSASYLYECWANFLYLDNSEREYFASTDLDMLIWQVQRVLLPADYRAELVFNHPIKFIASNVSVYTSGSHAGQDPDQRHGCR